MMMIRYKADSGGGVSIAWSLKASSPLEVAKAASVSSRSLAVLSAQARNDALTSIHQALAKAKDTIIAANTRDVQLAMKAAADGTLSQSILKRLDLSRKGKWEDMLQGILDVRDLEDPSHEGALRHSCNNLSLTLGVADEIPH